MSQAGHLNQVTCPGVPIAGSIQRQVEQSTPPLGIHQSTVLIPDREHPCLLVPGKEPQRHHAFTSRTGQHDRLGDPPRKDPTRTIGLVEVLPRPGPTADRDPGTISVDNQLLPAQAVITFRSPRREVSGPVDANFTWQSPPKPGDRHHETVESFLEHLVDGPLQHDVITRFVLLNRDTQLLEPGLLILPARQDDQLAVGSQGQLRTIDRQD